MTDDTSENEPFMKPLPPGKNGGSWISSDADFTNSNKNVSNEGGGFRKSSGSDQDGISSQNQTVAPTLHQIMTELY